MSDRLWVPTWRQDDGGRAAAGFSTANDAGDCFVRACAIALQLPYREVYDSVADLSAEMGGRRTARDGVSKALCRRWLAEREWTWTPTMHIGQGRTVHLRASELPAGRIIVQASKHVVAVVDGIAHDTHDPTRAGTRCVYGYWSPPRWADRE